MPSVGTGSDRTMNFMTRNKDIGRDVTGRVPGDLDAAMNAPVVGRRDISFVDGFVRAAPLALARPPISCSPDVFLSQRFPKLIAG